MKVSLVVVCHHSSEVLPRCLRSFRDRCAASGFEAEVVAVEQSEDAEQVAAVATCAPDVLLQRPNRGYAAGLNAGIAEASGDLLVLANPDLRFLDGSVAALAEAAVSDADVVGPQLLWDDDGRVVLPAPDDPGPWAELVRTLRRRRPTRRGIEKVLDAGWQLWTASAPVAVPSLRGPVMALGRDTANRLGPLDEGYFLYYEETDWLWRARRSGARLAIQPAARVVHRWGHATARRPDRAAVEQRSRERFFARAYPWWMRRLLGRLAPLGGTSDAGFIAVGGPAELPEVDAEVWLLSPVPTMDPSAGCLAVSRPPAAARELAARGRWYAVAARRAGRRWRLLGSWMWGRT